LTERLTVGVIGKGAVTSRSEHNGQWGSDVTGTADDCDVELVHGRKPISSGRWADSPKRRLRRRYGESGARSATLVVTVRDAGAHLVCTSCDRRYAVQDGIPVMLVDEAEPPSS
jgi:uncharacterized protein YbaR (Trm112 family)